MLAISPFGISILVYSLTSKKRYKVLDCFHHFISFCTCIKAHAKPLAHSLREVGSDGLGHAEAAHLLRAKDLGHLLVGDEVLLVVGVLIGSVNECMRDSADQVFSLCLTWRLFFLM